MTPVAPPIPAFLRERLPLQRGASAHTCDRSADALQLLVQFASERLRVTPSARCLQQLNAPCVMDFVPSLDTERHHSPRTRNRRLGAITSLMRFLEHREPSLWEQSRRSFALPAKRPDNRLSSSLSLEARHAVLNAPHLQRRDGIRDRAMLHRCFSAGLRGSEWLNLSLHAVACEPSPTVHLQGTGRRERLLPLWKQTATDGRAWLAVRGQPLSPALFGNARHQTMTRWGFAYGLRQHGQGAAERCPSWQAKRLSPHILRHTAAMLVLQATGDIRKVSLWLGHADIQTTEAYLRADPTEKLEAMDTMGPPTLKRGQFRAPDTLSASLRDHWLWRVFGVEAPVCFDSFVHHTT
jgi:integrase/recombinase XerD